MALTIVTLQMHYGGHFVSDPELRYANGITNEEKIDLDVDELHIMLFHKLALELDFDKVKSFGCKVNKKGDYYMLNFDSDLLNFFSNLNDKDFVNVFMVHQINVLVIVEPTLLLPFTADVSSPPNEKVDVCSP
ncbi:MAG: hypothetical protein Q8830_03735, partial [Candidatus Phytoplasma australasiaticum]|nr:hypothetical protein [Candidatus Phytoplasma australasiaticum]